MSTSAAKKDNQTLQKSQFDKKWSSIGTCADVRRWLCAYGVTLGSMHCFGQKFPLFMIWDTETKMGAVQMAII